MNKRQKKWKKEVNEGIRTYELKSGSEYDYYSKVSKKNKVKWRQEKGIIYWLRVIVGISLIVYTVLRYAGKV